MKIIFKLTLVWLMCVISGCTTLDPRRLDVSLPESAPEIKTTNYTPALNDLGMMSEIYDTPLLKIQSQPIGDRTGTSVSTGGEVQRDITEIMKSTLNSIGGKVVFIPYDPGFMQSQVVTGYSSFNSIEIPDVILSGGITEFDRGLEVRGSNTDLNAEAEFTGLPDSLPSKGFDMRYGGAEKRGMARITLDFNLLDFSTMTGISKMNTTNTMAVHKVMGDSELGISLFGQSFGAKGMVKKVQGRHAAVRVLVEISMIQIVGKHLMLPYWRLLGDKAAPDRIVLNALADYYSYLTSGETIAMAQEWLNLYGYQLEINGCLDASTIHTLQQVYPKFDSEQEKIDVAAFLYIYIHIPLNSQAREQRLKMNARLGS
ncbi:hypothetical protein KAR34_02800 [bacterium]|nr:hypothetical protein [bacterium]